MHHQPVATYCLFRSILFLLKMLNIMMMKTSMGTKCHCEMILEPDMVSSVVLYSSLLYTNET